MHTHTHTETHTHTDTHMQANSKHWFTTSFLQLWRKVPESGARSVTCRLTHTQWTRARAHLRSLQPIVTGCNGGRLLSRVLARDSQVLQTLKLWTWPGVAIAVKHCRQSEKGRLNCRIDDTTLKHQKMKDLRLNASCFSVVTGKGENDSTQNGNVECWPFYFFLLTFLLLSLVLSFLLRHSLLLLSFPPFFFFLFFSDIPFFCFLFFSAIHFSSPPLPSSFFSSLSFVFSPPPPPPHRHCPLLLSLFSAILFFV